MYFEGQFKQIGCVDVSNLKNLIKDISEAQWQAQSMRQEMYQVHKSTQTIPFIFDMDYRHHYPTAQPILKMFEEALKPIFQSIINFYEKENIITKRKLSNPVNKGYFVRVILVRMAADSQITPHKDKGYSLSRAHRIHLPIFTNDRVEFTVNTVTKSLAEGELWEINNRDIHSVYNKSDDVRIHFIFDFVIPGEVIQDSDGQTLHS